LAAAILSVSLPAEEAWSATYKLCMKWDITMNDSTFSITSGSGATVSEDYYPWVSHTVVARNVRVRITKGSLDTTIDTGSDGCFSFDTSVSPPFTIRAFAYAKDSGNNVTRVVDSQGSTRSFVKTISPPANQWTDVHFGSFTSPWATLAAVSAYSAYRHRWGATNKEMRVTECSTDFCNSSLVNTNLLPQGIGTIRIYNGSDTNTDRRYAKFMIAHELGHAWMRLYTGGLLEPWRSSTGLVDNTSSCSDGSSYGMLSLEWNVIGAKEAIAHVYSADIWNHHGSNEGIFRWFSTTYDLEFNNPANSGGYIENNCGPSSSFGKSVNIDWLRFFWDWHTPYTASSKPPLSQIRDAWHLMLVLDVVSKVVPPLTFDLFAWNYYQRFTQAMSITVDKSSWESLYLIFDGWNGVDTN
jgi:hypothetical protein